MSVRSRVRLIQSENSVSISQGRTGKLSENMETTKLKFSELESVSFGIIHFALLFIPELYPRALIPTPLLSSSSESANLSTGKEKKPRGRTYLMVSIHPQWRPFLSPSEKIRRSRDNSYFLFDGLSYWLEGIRRAGRLIGSLFLSTNIYNPRHETEGSRLYPIRLPCYFPLLMKRCA